MMNMIIYSWTLWDYDKSCYASKLFESFEHSQTMLSRLCRKTCNLYQSAYGRTWKKLNFYSGKNRQTLQIKLSSKHETFTQCWFNVGPPSATLDQLWTNIRWTSRVCWVIITCCRLETGPFSFWKTHLLLAQKRIFLKSSADMSSRSSVLVSPDGSPTIFSIDIKVSIKSQYSSMLTREKEYFEEPTWLIVRIRDPRLRLLLSNQ